MPGYCDEAPFYKAEHEFSCALLEASSVSAISCKESVNILKEIY